MNVYFTLRHADCLSELNAREYKLYVRYYKCRVTVTTKRAKHHVKTAQNGYRSISPTPVNDTVNVTLPK